MKGVKGRVKGRVNMEGEEGNECGRIKGLG